MKKFKFHWGWAILLVYATFMIVFLFYFYKSFKELETNELVTDDYYEKELVYGDILAKKKNADTMRMPVEIIHIQDGLLIKFPDYIEKATGTIYLYKPDNEKLDQKISIQLNENNQQKIEKSKLIDGRWNISLDWNINNTPYFIEKELFIN